MITNMNDTAPPKSEWGPGPWHDEPDFKRWEHHGFPCVIIRNLHLTGALGGNVGVPPGHPWHGTDADDVETHGGITFAGTMEHCAEITMEESAFYWFVGFNCGHYMDQMPAMDATMSRIHPNRKPYGTGIYRDVEYVTNAVNALAELARDAAG